MIQTPADAPAPTIGPLDRRATEVAALSRETWDVVIVGGGIVGVGALLDAVSRGMRVAWSGPWVGRPPRECAL